MHLLIEPHDHFAYIIEEGDYQELCKVKDEHQIIITEDVLRRLYYCQETCLIPKR